MPVTKKLTIAALLAVTVSVAGCNSKKASSTESGTAATTAAAAPAASAASAANSGASAPAAAVTGAGTGGVRRLCVDRSSSDHGDGRHLRGSAGPQWVLHLPRQR